MHCHEQEKPRQQCQIIRGWRSHEPLGGSGGMLPQKILKTRTPEMLFPAFWHVNFKPIIGNFRH